MWSALGGELKPSLDLVICAPLTDGRARVAGPPVLEEPRIEITQAAGRHVPEALDETVRAGSEARPGRIVRVRRRP